MTFVIEDDESNDPTPVRLFRPWAAMANFHRSPDASAEFRAKARRGFSCLSTMCRWFGWVRFGRQGRSNLGTGRRIGLGSLAANRLSVFSVTRRLHRGRRERLPPLLAEPAGFPFFRELLQLPGELVKGIIKRKDDLRRARNVVAVE